MDRIKSLTNAEIVDLLQSKIKPYRFTGMRQQEFSAKLQIIEGIHLFRYRLRDNTLISFFQHFGITGTPNNWTIPDAAIINTIPDKYLKTELK